MMYADVRASLSKIGLRFLSVPTIFVTEFNRETACGSHLRQQNVAAVVVSDASGYIVAVNTRKFDAKNVENTLRSLVGVIVVTLSSTDHIVYFHIAMANVMATIVH